MATILEFRPRAGDLVEMLEEALAMARRGEITGVALAAIGSNGAYTHTLAGTAKRDPALTAWALERLRRDLHRLADRLEGEG